MGAASITVTQLATVLAQVDEDGNATPLVGWLMIIAIVVAVVGGAIWNANEAAKRNAKKDADLGGFTGDTARSAELTYLGGHPSHPNPVSNSVLAATRKLLAVETPDAVLFKLPLADVTDINVETDDEARQRLTATRMLLVGVFALALPKKTAGSVLVTIETTTGPIVFERVGHNKAQVLAEIAGIRTRIAAQPTPPDPTPAGAPAPAPAPPPTLPTEGVHPAPPPTPATWAPDPHGRHELRYWDGTQWTEHISNAQVPGIDAV